MLLAIDQGTTGTTALVLDLEGRTVGRATSEFPQHFPNPGWVEHEPDEIWHSVLASTTEALRVSGLSGEAVRAVGITNQRETTLLWERGSGRPAHRAIVWQDRRTSEHCARLRAAGHEPDVRKRTGLVLDPYFSGTKIAWLLDEGGLRRRAEAGELAFGTIDSFLLYRLTGGAAHVTDITNASRTLLFNLRTLTWDSEMLALLRVPNAVLPRTAPSAGLFGVTKGFGPLPDGVPITGVAGDQHAALFGQACFGGGEGKCTYGTGAFVLVNTGSRPLESHFGLLTTPAWQIGEHVTYALEGSSFVAGAAVQWLRDGLKFIDRAADVEALARSVPSSEGVVVVPAFTGLGAPHWDAEARGLISGLTRGVTAAHLARATLEGIAFSVGELLQSMAEDLGAPLGRLRVDGGAAQNDLLMQMQSDFSGLLVERPTELESTARGAAMLAGLGAGLFGSPAEAARVLRVERTFTPTLPEHERVRRWASWHEAVGRAKYRPNPL
jgi:glycerol kinase